MFSPSSRPLYIILRHSCFCHAGPDAHDSAAINCRRTLSQPLKGEAPSSVLHCVVEFPTDLLLHASVAVEPLKAALRHECVTTYRAVVSRNAHKLREPRLMWTVARALVYNCTAKTPKQCHLSSLHLRPPSASASRFLRRPVLCPLASPTIRDCTT